MTWSAWKLDPATWAWIVWIVVFVIIEAWAVVSAQPQHTLTHHLRPLFTRHPLTWWLAFGFWAWLGLHFLAPRLEHRLLALFVDL